MSLHWSFLSAFLTIFILQVPYLYSTPINSRLTNANFDIPRTQNTLHYFIENILTESNLNEQAILWNQLREYLNRMCVLGYFGSSHAHACQRIVDIAHQLNSNEDETNITHVPARLQNEEHGIEKRFFCNGFIGCKNAGR